jgi:hypothetical protein
MVVGTVGHDSEPGSQVALGQVQVALVEEAPAGQQVAVRRYRRYGRTASYNPD